jgi:hypothetical protein
MNKNGGVQLLSDRTKMKEKSKSPLFMEMANE